MTDIRSEIWLKLWGVLAFNPISMLTRATLEEICSNPHARILVVEMMREAELIAMRLGIRFRVPLEKRIPRRLSVATSTHPISSVVLPTLRQRFKVLV